MAKIKVARKHLHFNDAIINAEKLDDSKQNRKFVGVAYSGKPILNHPHWGNLIFDLSDITSKPQIPVLFNHDTNRIVGFGSITVNDKY